MGLKAHIAMSVAKVNPIFAAGYIIHFRHVKRKWLANLKQIKHQHISLKKGLKDCFVHFSCQSTFDIINLNKMVKIQCTGWAPNYVPLSFILHCLPWNQKWKNSVFISRDILPYCLPVI